MTNTRMIGIIGAFAGVTVALCAFAVASTYAIRGLRLDLTEDRLYSLSLPSHRSCNGWMSL